MHAWACVYDFVYRVLSNFTRLQFQYSIFNSPRRRDASHHLRFDIHLTIRIPVYTVHTRSLTSNFLTQSLISIFSRVPSSPRSPLDPLKGKPQPAAAFTKSFSLLLSPFSLLLSPVSHLPSPVSRLRLRYSIFDIHYSIFIIFLFPFTFRLSPFTFHLGITPLPFNQFSISRGHTERAGSSAARPTPCRPFSKIWSSAGT